jgi:DNA-binding NarL/FixJ family response regulator
MTDLIILTRATLYQEAWRALLSGQPGIEVIGTVSQSQDLHRFVSQNHQPITILIDLALPDPAVAHQIKEITPTPGLLFLVDVYDLAEMVTLLQAGAAGCLNREATVADLSRGIIAAGRGEIVLPSEWATKALVALARGEVGGKRPSSSTLTEREQDVLGLLAQGMTNKDIAQSLFLSVRTIEAHLRNIYGKLAVATRTEAVLWAVQHGYKP